MENFDLKKFLSEKSLLNESAPGYDTRKTGEALPTLESVKAAYEAKNDIKEESTEVFTDAELDMASEMLMDMYDKLGLENNIEKSDALVKYINGWFENLAEGRLLKEEDYKTLEDFGPDLVGRLKGLGMDSKLFKGQMGVPNNARDAVANDPKKAAISYFEKNGNERIEIIVNKDKFDALKSIKTFFDSLEGDIDRGPIVLGNKIGLLSYQKTK